MAQLKSTQISGSLNVTENIVAQSVTASLLGTASYAIVALTASVADEAKSISSDIDLLTIKGLHVSGNAQVDGDLKVLGELTYVGVQDLRVKDKNIELNVDESGSAASASADGAGITIKNPQQGDIEFKYNETNDSMTLNKNLEFVSGAALLVTASEAVHATSASHADYAEEAAVANKVKFQLKLADNNSITGSAYDGSEEVVIGVNPSWLAQQSVAHAASASKVDHKLTVASDVVGRLTIDNDFDGEAAATISLNLSDLENSIASASATASSELQALSQSVATDFSASDAAREALSQSVSASVDDLQSQIDAISGGGTGSIDSKIDAKIAELDADASAAASGTPVSGGVFVLSGVAFNEADGKLTSGSATSVEVEKAGAAAAAVSTLSSSVATSITNVMASQSNYSSSMATVVSDIMASQSVLSQSVAADFLANASASDAALTAYSTSADTRFGEIEEAVEALESGSSEAVEELSQSVATFSASVITDFSASDAARVALSQSVASSSAAFSASVSSDIAAVSSSVVTVSSSLSSSIAALSSSADAAYVKKSGDTMTGNLDMGANYIKLGDMKVMWDATAQALQFVYDNE